MVMKNYDAEGVQNIGDAKRGKVNHAIMRLGIADEIRPPPRRCDGYSSDDFQSPSNKIFLIPQLPLERREIFTFSRLQPKILHTPKNYRRVRMKRACRDVIHFPSVTAFSFSSSSSSSFLMYAAIYADRAIIGRVQRYNFSLTPYQMPLTRRLRISSSTKNLLRDTRGRQIGNRCDVLINRRLRLS